MKRTLRVFAVILLWGVIGGCISGRPDTAAGNPLVVAVAAAGNGSLGFSTVTISESGVATYASSKHSERKRLTPSEQAKLNELARRFMFARPPTEFGVGGLDAGTAELSVSESDRETRSKYWMNPHSDVVETGFPEFDALWTFIRALFAIEDGM